MNILWKYRFINQVPRVSSFFSSMWKMNIWPYDFMFFKLLTLYCIAEAKCHTLVTRFKYFTTFYDTSKFLWLHDVYQVFWETHFPLLHQQERHKLPVKGEGCSPETLKSITFEVHLSARQQNKWEYKTAKYNSLKLLELKLSGRCCPTMAERSNWRCFPPPQMSGRGHSI